MFNGRGCVCSSRIALPIIVASGGKRARVVGHQQRAAGGRHVLHPLHLGPEPVAVEELDQRAVQQAVHALGAAPVGEPALGLHGGQQLAQLGRGAGPPARRAGSASGAGRSLWLSVVRAGLCHRSSLPGCPPHAHQGRGSPGHVALDGPRGRVALPGGRGTDPQLRRRQGGGRAPGQASRCGWRPRRSRPTPTRPRPTPAGSPSRRARRS